MLSLHDAKNRFSAVVDAALAGRPQAISRRGKPAVVVIAVEEYDRLLRAAKADRESFTEHLLTFPGDADLRTKVRPRDVDFGTDS